MKRLALAVGVVIVVAIGIAGWILRDRIRTLRGSVRREAFLTLSFGPGEAAQVDWADFGFALPGCMRRVSAFVMVLCYSRQLYLEFTLSQSMGTFLRCMDRALTFFGGSTAQKPKPPPRAISTSP